MIISHQHKYLFVEVPHTGSHSIASELLEFYGGERILHKHANLTQFMSQASKAERGYFVFGTVRNPLDAAVTDYSKMESNHRGQFTNPEMFIENGGHITPQHRLEFAFVNTERMPFHEFVMRYRRKVYHNWFLVGSARFNFVLRFERLAASYRELFQHLGLELVRDLPHVNPTKKKIRNYLDYYTPATREFVAKYYGPFMEKWDYAFPDSWGYMPIPVMSRVKFGLVEAMVGAAARHVRLDPNNRSLNRIKRLVETIC